MAENITSTMLVALATFLMIMVSLSPTPVLASGRYTVLQNEPLNEGNQTANNNNVVLRLPLGIKIALPASIFTIIILVYWIFKGFRIECKLVRHRRENGGTTHTSRAGIELSERVNDETDPEQNNSDEQQCNNELR
ncbi:unnamed protein product [Amaranthus hypochondriacus]